jgi:transcription antitermination factor NusG
MVSWMAVWTRSRHEKLVRDHLAAQEVEVFLPLLNIPSSRRDRQKMIDLPAFPCYLFARLDPCDAYVVKTTRGVVSILGPKPMDYSVVPDEQVEAVRQMLTSTLKVDPFPYLQKGTRVRIKSGPLEGIEGILVEKRNRCRFVVNVDLLNQSIATEVSGEQIEAA